MFILKRYKDRLKIMSWFHYLLFVEMLVGALVLHSFLTIGYSIQSKYDGMKQDVENLADNLIFVHQTAGPSSPTSGMNTAKKLPLSHSDLEAFRKLYNDQLNVQIKLLQSHHFVYNRSIETIYILFVSDPSVGKHTVLVGDKVADIVESGKLSHDLPYQMQIMNNRFNFILQDGNSKTFEVNSMDQHGIQFVKLNSGEIPVDFSKTVIAPIDLYFQNEMSAMGDTSNINVSFYFSDDQKSFQIKNEILRYLSEKYANGNTTFRFDTRLEQFRRMTSEMKRISESVSALCMFSLLIMGAGLIGLMINMVQKRRKEIAICKSVGASNMHLFGEIALEALTLTIFPALVSVILSVMLTGRIKFKEFLIIQSGQASLITITFSLLIGVFAIMLSMYKIYKVYPAEEIRRE